jgi:restriction system protein
MSACFRAMPGDLVDTVTVNGKVYDTDPATGRPAHPCVISVSAARSTFDELQLDDLKLKAHKCLQRLEAVLSLNPFALEPVEPRGRRRV